MKVYKFGGASIATADRMASLLPIINVQQEPLLIVISAMGKTTNALEKILIEACEIGVDAAVASAELLIQQHRDYVATLLNEQYRKTALKDLKPLFAELLRVVKRIDADRYDFSYDQVVCMGELFSSCIFASFLQQNGIATVWVDARKVIRTDNTYRDAAINWDYTKLDAEVIIGRQMKNGGVVVTQGFIGSTHDGTSVTLGREGSDYTAAVLAAMLSLESVTIWKDVDGFRNADPKMFKDTVRIGAISYREVIEMAFYGAQIIHPKTIKPLQNYNIPLYVKCFLDKDLPGSMITNETGLNIYPPMMVLKERQVLVHVTTRDFSFITEDNLSRLYAVFHDLKVKINLIQNAAISFIAVIDKNEDKINDLRANLHEDYKVIINEDVTVLTIRYQTPEIVAALTANKEILLQQETRKTMQAVIK